MGKYHSQTLQGTTLLEEGLEHCQIWKHLPAKNKDGRQNAFVCEYDYGTFDYTERKPKYAQVFNQAWGIYSFT